ATAPGGVRAHGEMRGGRRAPGRWSRAGRSRCEYSHLTPTVPDSCQASCTDRSIVSPETIDPPVPMTRQSQAGKPDATGHPPNVCQIGCVADIGLGRHDKTLGLLECAYMTFGVYSTWQCTGSRLGLSQRATDRRKEPSH